MTKETIFFQKWIQPTFLQVACHLRQSLRFLSEVASLDNITRQLLPHTTDFTQLCPRKGFPLLQAFPSKMFKMAFKIHPTNPILSTPSQMGSSSV